jgi:hypothetical protein
MRLSVVVGPAASLDDQQFRLTPELAIDAV